MLNRYSVYLKSRVMSWLESQRANTKQKSAESHKLSAKNQRRGVGSAAAMLPRGTKRIRGRVDLSTSAHMLPKD